MLHHKRMYQIKVPKSYDWMARHSPTTGAHKGQDWRASCLGWGSGQIGYGWGLGCAWGMGSGKRKREGRGHLVCQFSNTLYGAIHKMPRKDQFELGTIGQKSLGYDTLTTHKKQQIW